MNYWKPHEELTPKSTIYGDGLNPKRLERLVLNQDGSFTRTIPAGQTGRSGDITRIIHALSGDGDNLTKYQFGEGSLKIKLDRKLVNQIVGIKAGFALSTNDAKALSVVDDNAQIILMAGNGKGNTFELWFTGYYEHVAPKKANGTYPLTKTPVLDINGNPARFPADEWIDIRVFGRMNTFINGEAQKDAVCAVFASTETGSVLGEILGEARLQNFIISDLHGNGWTTAEWVCFSGGEGDIYKLKEDADIHFRNFQFSGYDINEPPTEPTTPSTGTGMVSISENEYQKLIATIEEQNQKIVELDSQLQEVAKRAEESFAKVQQLYPILHSLEAMVITLKDILK